MSCLDDYAFTITCTKINDVSAMMVVRRIEGGLRRSNAILHRFGEKAVLTATMMPRASYEYVYGYRVRSPLLGQSRAEDRLTRPNSEAAHCGRRWRKFALPC